MLSAAWIVLASAVTAGLLTVILSTGELTPTLKALVIATTFLAWAGGIATAWIWAAHPATVPSWLRR